MITEFRRGNNVKRFHTTRRIQGETVGHHSANVCAILLRLYPNISRDLLVAALVHDLPEQVTGDIPAPAKWGDLILRDCLYDAETEFINDNDIPDPELTPQELSMLKIADMTDLVLSCLEEINMGNKHARELLNNGLDWIEGNVPHGEVHGRICLMIKEVQDECE